MCLFLKKTVFARVQRHLMLCSGKEKKYSCNEKTSICSSVPNVQGNYNPIQQAVDGSIARPVRSRIHFVMVCRSWSSKRPECGQSKPPMNLSAWSVKRSRLLSQDGIFPGCKVAGWRQETRAVRLTMKSEHEHASLRLPPSSTWVREGVRCSRAWPRSHRWRWLRKRILPTSRRPLGG